MVGGALLLGFGIVLVRGEPTLIGDPGVFLSIAARMLDGDGVYSEVVDNKDPLFFYTYAGALWIGGWRGPFALDGVWLAVAAVSLTLLLRELRAPTQVLVAGFLMYPLSLTIGWYSPGLSMLAGLAFAPLVGWFWLRGRFAGSGALLGIVVLFKLNLALVAAAPVAAFLLLGAPGGSRTRQMLKAAVGGWSVVIGVAAAVLAARGEFRAYLDILVDNVHYASDYGLGSRETGGILGHLEVVVEYLGTLQAVGAIVVLGVFSVAVYYARNRGDRALQLLAACALSTVVATFGTLALTALWRHHLQMLSFPLVLVAAVLISAGISYYGQRGGVLLASACVLFVLVSFARAELRNGISASGWFSDPASDTGVALETARKRFFGGLDRVPYMVFGYNFEQAHAVFIDDAFALACRRFHQYPQEPPEVLSGTLDCVSEKSPLLILVLPTLFDRPSQTRAPPPYPPRPVQWQTFVSGVQRMLESRYEMVSDDDGIEVWKLAEAPSAG